MAQSADGLTIAARLVKGVAIAVGGACTFVGFASIVGYVTSSGWARGLVALLLTGLFPAFAVDRALPKGDVTKGRPGLVANVVALVLLSLALLLVGFGQPVTGPLLVKEGDRLSEEGMPVLAHVVYLMGGVRAVDALVAATPPAPSASAPGGP
jgi:hypothetical protein